MAEKKVISVFWTGGWDSTYRIVELSRMEIIIHPVYCLDPKRISTSLELKHMEDILEIIAEKTETKAEFLSIEKIDITTLKPNKEIEKAWKRIVKTIHLGSQYIWLAKIAKQYPGIELGLEKPNGEFSGAITAITRLGNLIYKDGVYVCDKAKSSEDILAIFGNVSLPIANLTETDMLKNIKQWGYEDIMKKIWFCHTPISGNTCGVCRPCQQMMECHMEFLLDKPAQRRYKIFRFISKFIGARITSKTMRILLCKEK